MSDGITEARRGFASYFNRQFDEFTTKVKKFQPLVLAITMSEEDCDLFQKSIDKDYPEFIGVGEYAFDYVGKSIYEPKTTQIIKIGGGLFTYTFKENIETVKNYISDNEFRFGRNSLKFNLLKIERLEYSIDAPTEERKDIEKIFIFRVKVDPHSARSGDIKSDSDGVIFIATENPSIIYSKIKVEDIISVEKISSGYIFR